ncbi:ArsR family transcriptional regulator [Euryarchaeota archaeon ex4484_178]|nr:MAG: ArsR family transcriptional regulator [Euryarchaeota archaeon ex4484_178]
MNEIDAILAAIENQTRREILKRLAEGRQYALQLAKELRVSQQAILKHLEVLERYNIIRRAGMEKSDMGPPRKLYELSKGFSIVIDFAPGLFEIRRYPIDLRDEEDDKKETIEEDFGEALRKIENEIRELERRRLRLIKMKERILRELMEG